ncbi:ATP-binding protein [Aquimarina addita]|uniref:histidine kinase n=1 Tax=Aquimarina addita TaxID=870485 RepID=A0ABP7X919_9FLAO
MSKLKLQVLLLFIVCISQKGTGQINNAKDNPDSSLTSASEKKKEKKEIEHISLLFRNDKAEQAYNKALLISKNLKDKESIVTINLFLSRYFYKKSLLDSSIHYAKKALKVNTISNDSIKNRKKGQIYEVLGASYTIKGLYNESKKWHLMGMNATEKYGEKEFYYSHLHNLAISYMMLEDYTTALQYFKQCLIYQDDEELTYLTYSNIGDIYGTLGQFDVSNDYLEKANVLLQKTGDTYMYAITLISIGSNYQKQGNLEKAISLYQDALVISNKNNYDYITLTANFNIGISLIETEEYKKATTSFLTVITDAKKLGILQEQMDSYEQLKEIALLKKDYKKSYTYLVQETQIKDSIIKSQKRKEIAQLEIQYKTLKKEKEITFLQAENAHKKLDIENQKKALDNIVLQQKIEQKENSNKILSFQNYTEKTLNENILLKKNQQIKDVQFKIQETETLRQKGYKNIILYSFLVILIPIIGLLIIYYQKLQAQSELNRKQEEISQQKISSLIKDQELKLIKATIEVKDKERERIAQELHDSIGGNLAAIKIQLNNAFAKVKKDELKIINTHIDDTYEQVRSISNNLIPEKFSKNLFSDVLEEYFNTIITSSNLTGSFTAYPRKKIDTLHENLQIEVFKIIQELLTNTIKHANASTIVLQLNLIDTILNILFEDNGIGFNVENSTDGIGFRNIKSRLKQLSGTLYIDSRMKRGTIMNIEIPNTTIFNEINSVTSH